jgi:hypothetical protein
MSQVIWKHDKNTCGASLHLWGNKTPWYCVKKVLHGCKMLMIGVMELLILEGLSKKRKKRKETKKVEKAEKRG